MIKTKLPSEREMPAYNMFVRRQLEYAAAVCSVLPRLRFCAIVAQNFECDAAKTVLTGHLAHIDFGLSQDFESVGIPVVVTAILIGVLDF